MGGGPTRWHIGRYRQFLGSSCLEPDAWECRWVGSLDELREHSLEWRTLKNKIDSSAMPYLSTYSSFGNYRFDAL